MVVVVVCVYKTLPMTLLDDDWESMMGAQRTDLVLELLLLSIPLSNRSSKWASNTLIGEQDLTTWLQNPARRQYHKDN